MDILINKSYKNYNKLSRYSPFPYYYHRKDNKYIYGKTAYLKDDTPFTLHIINTTDTLDSIALYYYNNPTLYWIICDFNRITDPYIKLKAGDTLKIPSISNIEFNT